MLADEYTLKYICPECGRITSHVNCGPRSEITRMLKHMIRRIFCSHCTKTAATMDILRVQCKVGRPARTIEERRQMAWICDRCHTRWSTSGQLNLGPLDMKPSHCIHCCASPVDIHLTSVINLQLREHTRAFTYRCRKNISLRRVELPNRETGRCWRAGIRVKSLL